MATLVASVTRQTAGTSGNIDTTGASFLVAVVTALTATTISDSKSNTWVPLTEAFINGFSTWPSRLFYVENPTVGTGHNFTISGNNEAVTVVAAFSGMATSSVWDGEESVISEATFPDSAGAITPVNADSLIIAGLGNRDTHADLTIGGGFTIIDAITGTPFVSLGCALAYLVQSGGPAAVDPEWDGTGAAAIALNIASFVTAGTGGGGGTGQPTTKRFGGVAHMGQNQLRGGHRGGVWGRTSDGIVVPRRFAA